MDKSKAKKAQDLMNELEEWKKRLQWITENDRQLYFGTRDLNFGDNMSVSLSSNYPFRTILDRHHEMIINEVKEAIADTEREIEEL